MQPTSPSAREFQPLLQGVIDLLKAHPVALLLPLVLLGLLSGGGDSPGRIDDAFDPPRGGDFDPPWLLLGPLIGLVVLVAVIVLVLLLLLHALVWGVTGSATLTALEGGTPDLSRAFEHVRPRFTGLLVTFLLYGLACAIGFVLLLIPGVLVAAVLAPWLAVVLREGRSGIDALTRAFQITEGDRLTLFLLVGAGVAVSFVAGLVLGWLPIVGGALSGIVSGVVMAGYVVLGVLYYERKVGRPAPAAPVVVDQPPVA